MIDDESLVYFCLTAILIVQSIQDVQRDSEFVHEYDNYPNENNNFISIR